MRSTASSPEDYLGTLPEERKPAMSELRNVIIRNLPKGFEEIMAYGMISYVVPHSLYPAGYHCDPKQPLPFLSLASQKNFVALYHMGIYADAELLEWFVIEYNNTSKARLDMGKSCIRFKNTEHIPFQLIGELASRMTPTQWIALYESRFKKTD